MCYFWMSFFFISPGTLVNIQGCLAQWKGGWLMTPRSGVQPLAPPFLFFFFLFHFVLYFHFVSLILFFSFLISFLLLIIYFNQSPLQIYLTKILCFYFHHLIIYFYYLTFDIFIPFFYDGWWHSIWSWSLIFRVDKNLQYFKHSMNDQ